MIKDEATDLLHFCFAKNSTFNLFAILHIESISITTSILLFIWQAFFHIAHENQLLKNFGSIFSTALRSKNYYQTLSWPRLSDLQRNDVHC